MDCAAFAGGSCDAMGPPLPAAPTTVELVTFRLRHGDREQFLDANGPLNDWLKRQPGFVSRHLAEQQDGGFVDIVFWESHAAALAASGKVMEEMAQNEAMAMIDPMGLGMQHLSIRLSTQ